MGLRRRGGRGDPVRAGSYSPERIAIVLVSHSRLWGGELSFNPPCGEAVGRGTAPAGRGGGAATSRHCPSVRAPRCHLPLAARQGGSMRSEERRVGQACVSQCKSGWWPLQ